MKKRYVLIATGLGLGFSPVAPGTIGAMGGCLAGILVMQYAAFPQIILSLLIILFFFLGVYSSAKIEEYWGNDPQMVVIDEIVGMWISMLMLPSGWWCIAAAFILFRLFDIYKPLFIRRTEKFKHGWGIMLDDVVAGIYSNLTIQVIAFLLKSVQ